MDPREDEYRGQPGTLHMSEDLSETKCWALLSTQQTGRFGFLRDGAVHIYPVNYLVQDGAIYFRTRDDGDIGSALPLEGCAFQVDQVRSEAMAGWSVLANGTADVVRDEALLTELWGRSAEEPWAGGSRTTFVELQAGTISGRSVQAV
ncbi:Nitroimidazol reductase NimA, pyridoxamine 5'-phosphate oxidase superfamily [Arthrobacter subterraneus]|uniref:Nitroimidazol reductase NimA, pyridoxamine 5'-phosphate oxidase superfamily n=1 Tax=Arthrobacter subterraneus TaxID=335973 RepID=A0A1G8GMW0_9MICC|nr:MULTISPECIES: pyridoxamine 5'-phosphate oxidase family protein [Arthrobacter]SDH95719.1 Nitroimidazol reductase NimA, pyridoxamine 5'-phosphate oxidase superfamily [Arthrobacter subterraneus]